MNTDNNLILNRQLIERLVACFIAIIIIDGAHVNNINMGDIMSDYVAGKGTTAMSIIGTALGGLNTLGGGILGNIGNNNQYVNKETYEVQLKLIEAEKNNAILAADLSSEKKMVEVFNAANEKANAVRDELKAEIHNLETTVANNTAAQGVINAQFGSQINLNTSNIAQLFSMTKLVIPNTSVCPGWGAVSINPTIAGTTTT